MNGLKRVRAWTKFEIPSVEKQYERLALPDAAEEAQGTWHIGLADQHRHSKLHSYQLG